MTIPALHRNENVVALSGRALQSLRERSNSLLYAAVLTDDGFEVVSVRAGATAQGDRFASIASSLQALGEAAARELLADAEAPTVLIAAKSGHIVQVRVSGAALVISALFGSEETVGHALASTRVTANEISTALASPV